MYENQVPLNLIDEAVDRSECTERDVMKIIEIALMCTQSVVSERPKMSEVLMLLNDRSGDHKPPNRLPFNVSYLNVHVDDPSYVASSTSNAVASLTELTGR